MKKYACDVESIVEEDGSTIGYMTKGHHEAQAFIDDCAGGWDVCVQTEDVRHGYWRVLPPDAEGFKAYQYTAPGPGAFPVTYTYDVVVAGGATEETEGDDDDLDELRQIARSPQHYSNVALAGALHTVLDRLEAVNASVLSFERDTYKAGYEAATVLIDELGAALAVAAARSEQQTKALTAIAEFWSEYDDGEIVLALQEIARAALTQETPRDDH